MFRVGQMVVCVKRGPWTGQWGTNPTYRSVYTIRETQVGPDGDLYLRFEEIRNPKCPLCGIEPAYWSRRFRPVKTTNIDVFTKMLAPAPRELEPVS